MQKRRILTACFLMCLTLPAARADAAELLVGAATADITPEGPVALLGQFYLRVSQKVETPLVAGVLVLESREDDRSVDAAVMIACDLCLVRAEGMHLAARKCKRFVKMCNGHCRADD